MSKRAAILAGTLLAATALLWGQEETTRKQETESEDHQPAIHGIRIGMATQEVLDLLGRMPDQRKDETDEIHVYWKLKDGSVLQVNFRQDNYVSHIGLQYRPPRRTNDLWLLPLRTAGTTTDLTARDPRLRVDYRASQTDDRERTAWLREEKDPRDFRVEIRFLSAPRKRLGERFESEVEFKYVSVNKYDLAKFDRAMKAAE